MIGELAKMPTHTFNTQFTTKFEYIQAKTSATHRNSADFTLVYVHGLNSDPWGRKPEEIKKYCAENGISFFRFELLGHGSDSSSYEQVDFEDWKKQILEVVDEMVEGKILLVGSSLGGWLSLLAARDRPERVIGVIGLAPAPDFTYDVERFVLTEAQKAELSKGRVVFPMKDFSYVFMKRMFDTARDNLLLEKPLPISCPVHIIHGTEDKNLDPQKPFKLLKCLETNDVVLKLIKGSNHRLGRDVDIRELKNSIKDFLDRE